MPAQSKSQLKYIYSLRNKYKSKENTPDAYKWIWKDEWVDVKFSSLPDKKESVTKILDCDFKNQSELENYYLNLQGLFTDGKTD